MPNPAVSPAISAAKGTLRSHIKSRLSKIPADLVAEQTRACQQTLFALPEYAAASRLSVFLSMPAKEIDTSAIVENSLRKGKTLYVPYIHRQPVAVAAASSVPPSLMDMLSLASLDDYQSLKPDAWGIPSISKESIAGRRDGIRDGLDLVLMPGVAFDETFGRLGHGKGYYDYFLARYKKETGKSPLLVALAFGEQLLGKGEVPMDVMDWPVDIIVTGDGGCLRRRDLLPN